MTDIVEFLRAFAPEDVRRTVDWLYETGHQLAVADTDRGTFGSTLVFRGDAEVHITVDKSQWYMDVASSPGAERYQFDLLIPAARGVGYAECFPDHDAHADQLPEQLPPGVAWRKGFPRSSPMDGSHARLRSCRRAGCRSALRAHLA